MGDILDDFINFFRLGDILSPDSLSVGSFIGHVTLAFFGLIFTIIGVRIIFELIKIVTDWSRFK